MSDMNDALALLRDYLSADYRVKLDAAELVLRVGEEVTHSRLENGRSFAFMTAWNPRSMAQSRTANEAAQRGLEALLAEAGAELHPAVGGDSEGRWKEGSVFALDVSAEAADALAIRFEQNAIVAGVTGETARLRVYRVEWRDDAERAKLDTRFVDWVASPPASNPPAH